MPTSMLIYKCAIMWVYDLFMKQRSPQSRYTRGALKLFGMAIRERRLAQKMTAAELADRVGVSRGLVQRLEKGEAGTAIGVAFEAATIVGLRLFDTPPSTITEHITSLARVLTLMPKSARRSKADVDDDF